MASLDFKQRQYPLLEIRKRVLLPGVLLRIQIGRSKSVCLVESFWDAKAKTNKKDSFVAVSTVEFESDGGNDSTATVASSSSSEAAEDVFNVVDIPEQGGLRVYEVGTVARILQISRVDSSNSEHFQFSLLVEGVARFKIDKLICTDPFHVVQVLWLTDIGSDHGTDVQALAMNLRNIARNMIELQRKQKSPVGSQAKQAIETLYLANPGRLADMLTAYIDASVEEKQGVLVRLDLESRLRKVLELFNRQLEVFKLSEKIQEEVESKLKNTQREYFLRQQLRAINEELGSIGNKKRGSNGTDSGDSSMNENDILERSLNEAGLPDEARQASNRELQRLRQMQPSQPEYSVIRTYLELMAELPWSVSTKDNLNIAHARATLDHDHHGLDKIKKRIAEFLAVQSLKPDMKGPILCLVGPPGVGKTSLGKSIADAMGRKFRRLAFGGVKDEAEIRGHRRTYIGAMPGNIITCLKRAGSNNPVLLLDEIDKLGNDVRGDPSSALLEVLDPEQNNSFIDHYLGVPFDLSKVLFVATANRIDTISRPLRDRMEIIELSGYTHAEKFEIAMRHLIPKQIKRHGINSSHIDFLPSAVDLLVSSYTREAGVRNLEREIECVCRYAAVRVVESRDRALQNRLKKIDEGSLSLRSCDTLNNTNQLPPSKSSESITASEGTAEASIDLEEDFSCFVVSTENIHSVLGPSKYESEIAARTAVPGVATGLAWTSVGGEILFIEAWLHRGSGRITLTGQLGSVMQESVKAALSFIRGNLEELGLNIYLQEALGKADLHVHFPAGAVPKDGPSAGVAVTAAVLSALSGSRVRADTACTGEITLRGLVLPVGGIKEKVLAAHRAGIRRIVLPRRNEKDIIDIPESVISELEVHFVSTIVEAMKKLFENWNENKNGADTPRWLKDFQEEKKQNDKQDYPVPSASSAIGVSIPMEQELMGQGAMSFCGCIQKKARDTCGPADIISSL